MAAVLKSCCINIPQRWVIVTMGFLGLFSAYHMRICLSIAITEMVESTEKTLELKGETCPGLNNSINSEGKNDIARTTRLFDWDEYTQGIILSSFYWGYLFTNLPGGVIAERFGGRHTLGLGILSTSLLTLATPLVVRHGGLRGLIALRVLMGVGEGPTYPALTALLSQWIPEDERSKASALTFSGAYLGTIFGMSASGIILKYTSDWEVVFYFYGVMGLVAFLLNAAFCYSRPDEHPFISEREAKYLKEKLTNNHANSKSIPWRAILRSKPVWALMIATIGNAWGFITIVSDMPKYLGGVLKFSIESNGYLSSLPYLCKWIVGIVASSFADHLVARGRLSIGQVRKIGSAVAAFGPGVFMVAVSYAGCDKILAVSFLTLGQSLLGCATFSVLANALDLGPNYAGTIMGLVNGISTLSGIFSPYLVGLLTPNSTVDEWRSVFWIVFLMFAVTEVVFLIWGSGELQEWNDPDFLADKEREREKDVVEGVQLLQKNI
ncbi:sialin-like [Trichogramma pretiosum]|uniref:sialin-like n=1 Tax=Trichogramma pretiosum TaxID=7493 RepID=UPI0006C98F2C|nr:sialin-like [Trichogramma pretiosum]XP_023315717.1 sialin-like [Trichogramma pretiosum]